MGRAGSGPRRRAGPRGSEARFRSGTRSGPGALARPRATTRTAPPRAAPARVRDRAGPAPGPDQVALLVDGVTKLDKVKFGEAAQAET
ncbi:hypothetical protein ABZ566_13590, partial [Streptomyces hygroscopicus]|uniref:hypothetical protein n=1 Tax=Streptomyces hygroscopicus TaxID=1912 RepID=UPI0033CB347B